MFTRRSFNLASIGLATVFGTAHTASAAEAAKEVFEITKSDGEWKKQLSADQFYVLRKHGTERPGSSPSTRLERLARTRALGAICPSTVQTPSSIAERAGRVSSSRSTTPSARVSTAACFRPAPKFIAVAVADTWAMSSTTAPHPRASGTA
jgi:hypothetical protein